MLVKEKLVSGIMYDVNSEEMQKIENESLRWAVRLRFSEVLGSSWFCFSRRTWFRNSRT